MLVVLCVKHDQGLHIKFFMLPVCLCAKPTGVQERGETVFTSNPFSLRSLTFSLLVSLSVSPPPSCENMKTRSKCSSHTQAFQGQWKQSYTLMEVWTIDAYLNTPSVYPSISSRKVHYLSVTNPLCRNKQVMNPCVSLNWMYIMR